MWSRLGHAQSLAFHPWPGFDPALAERPVREYAVQVNGRVRHRFVDKADLDGDALLAAAKAEAPVVALLTGRTITKEIAVRGRLVNFVLR